MHNSLLPATELCAPVTQAGKWDLCSEIHFFQQFLCNPIMGKSSPLGALAWEMQITALTSQGWYEE
jgi:hypothetical protein